MENCYTRPGGFFKVRKILVAW